MKATTQDTCESHLTKPAQSLPGSLRSEVRPIAYRNRPVGLGFPDREDSATDALRVMQPPVHPHPLAAVGLDDGQCFTFSLCPQDRPSCAHIRDTKILSET